MIEQELTCAKHYVYYKSFQKLMFPLFMGWLRKSLLGNTVCDAICPSQNSYTSYIKSLFNNKYINGISQFFCGWQGMLSHL